MIIILVPGETLVEGGGAEEHVSHDGLVYRQYGAAEVVSSNTESFFSHVGGLQDERKCMNSDWLATQAFIKGQTVMPSVKSVKSKYYETKITPGQPDTSSSDDSSDSDSDSPISPTRRRSSPMPPAPPVEPDSQDSWEDTADAPLDATEPRLLLENSGDDDATAAGTAIICLD